MSPVSNLTCSWHLRQQGNPQAEPAQLCFYHHTKKELAFQVSVSDEFCQTDGCLLGWHGGVRGRHTHPSLHKKLRHSNRGIGSQHTWHQVVSCPRGTAVHGGGA